MKSRSFLLFMAGIMLWPFAHSANGGVAFSEIHGFVQYDTVGGYNSQAALVQSSNGNLYGTTCSGGANRMGTIFEISTNGSSFGTSSFDIYNGGYLGGGYIAGPIIGTDGNLYGTTQNGGAYLAGEVYGYTSTGMNVLHSFDNVNDVYDGALPYAGLVQGVDGNYYGTTTEGGWFTYLDPNGLGYGTIFKITPTGSLNTLHSFGGSDGFDPCGNLVQGKDGGLYGTTQRGGANECGTVFKITTNGVFNTLYSFTGGGDGAWPLGGLVPGKDNSFYGTTYYRGAYTSSDSTGNGYGTVFKIEANGSLTTLASFNNTNGANPNSSLVLDSDGNVYGTTYNGLYNGSVIPGYVVYYPNFGTIFQMTPAGVITSLVSFDVNDGYGAYPNGLIQAEDGSLYGTCQNGGTYFNASGGIVFRLSVPKAATGSLKVSISPAAAITAGARWQVDDGNLQNSGATVTNLSVGNHTVSFSTISGWTTPGNQTVSIKEKSITKTKGTYIFSAQGIYNGLFAQAEATEETAGMLSGLDVTASGTYTGKLLIGGSTNAISGGFNASGQASNHVSRTAKQGGPLTLEMTLNWNESPPNITGTVSGTNGGAWVANLTNELAVEGASSAAYTALLLPAGSPPGYGYILITNHAGIVTLSGALADGTAFSQGGHLSGAGDVPVYGNLYGGTGLLLGWIGLESGSPVGNLTWIRPASHSSVRYASGFTNLAVVQGSPWTNPLPHTAAIDLPSGQLDISGGGLLSNLAFNVAVSSSNTLVKLAGSPTNSLSGSINRTNGLLTIKFGNGAGKATTTGTGAVLQNVNGAGGFFPGKTNAGSIFLQP